MNHSKHVRNLFYSLGAAVALLALTGHPAYADANGGDVTVLLTATAGDPIEQNNLSQTTPIFTTPIGPDGLFADDLATPIVDGSILTIDAASVVGDADPFLDLDFTVTNKTGFEAEVIVTALVPLSAVFGPGLAVDASASMSVTDPADNGFLLGPIPGAAIFEGSIDGEIVRTLFDSSTTSSISQPPGGVGSAGYLAFPINDELHADLIADESIGITSRFILGPGDVADFSGFFSVAPIVPEPSALILGLACIACVARGGR